MTARVIRPLAASIFCVAALVVVRVLAFGVDAVQQLDARTLNRLSERRWTSGSGAVAAVVVHLGAPLVVLALLIAICGLALWLRQPQRAVAAVVLVAGANLTTQALKMTISPARFQPILDFNQVGATAFPSGHTTAAASLAFALAIVAPRRWRPAALAIGTCIAVAVGCAVVIRHWHYPSDAVGGVLVAAGWAFAVVAGLRVVELGSRSAPS